MSNFKFVVDAVFLDDEVVDNELLTLGGVLTHVVGEQFLDGIFLAQTYLVETDTGTDKTLEFIGRNLSKTFESCDLGILALGDGFEAFFLRIAIDRLVLVLDAEERCLEDIDVAFLDEVGEELQEECQHQQTDMHTVHIGIGGDDDFVITQFIEAVFDIEGRLKAVELFVLIHHRFAEAVTVERFTAEREDGLRTDVTTLGDRTGSGQTLGDEDAGFETLRRSLWTDEQVWHH